MNNFCNMNYTDVTDEINSRILARNMATGNIDVLLSPRPQRTRYVMPYQNIIPPPQCHSRVVKYSTDVADTFNPGNTKGAWSGFTTNIDTESQLRNQIYALQNAPQSTYIPSSGSDLYNSTLPLTNGSTAEALYPSLFNGNLVPKNVENIENKLNKKEEPRFKRDNNNCLEPNLGNKLFNNDTRQQLKDN